MKKRSFSFSWLTLLFLFCGTGFLFADGPRAYNELDRGITQFGASNFSEALHTFRNIIADPDMYDAHGDAYFWLAKSHMALNNLNDAEKNLEYFLLNFEENVNFPEAIYQKGRLLFQQREYEKVVQVLYNFIEQYQDHPYVGNAYFWVGESLYNLGHFDKALRVYRTILQEYPKSFKIDASRYRISVIELKYREQELMKFLKWSHEEALKTLEEFQIREKTYEQAISAYQKKLSEYAEAGTERKIEELTLDVREKEAEIVDLQNRIDELSEQNQDYEESIASLTDENASLKKALDEGEIPTAITTEVVTDAEAADLVKMLNIKQEALELKAFYLDWLEENSE